MRPLKFGLNNACNIFGKRGERPVSSALGSNKKAVKSSHSIVYEHHTLATPSSFIPAAAWGPWKRRSERGTWMGPRQCGRGIAGPAKRSGWGETEYTWCAFSWTYNDCICLLKSSRFVACGVGAVKKFTSAMSFGLGPQQIAENCSKWPKSLPFIRPTRPNVLLTKRHKFVRFDDSPTKVKVNKVCLHRL